MHDSKIITEVDKMKKSGYDSASKSMKIADEMEWMN